MIKWFLAALIVGLLFLGQVQEGALIASDMPTIDPTSLPPQH